MPLVILAYHGLVENLSVVLDDFCFVTPSKMVSDLRLVRSLGWQFISLREGILGLQNGGLTKPSVAVTFDDGFLSVLSLGLDLLREANCKATVFVPSGVALEQNVLWFVRVISLLKGTQKSDFNFLGRPINVGDHDSRVKANRLIQRTLKGLHPAAIQNVLEQMRVSLGLETEELPVDVKTMSLKDCRDALDSGFIDFGAHSATHAIHSQLHAAELRAEIKESISFLKLIIPDLEYLYAYPNGRKQDFGPRCSGVLAEHNIHCALTTIPGWNYSFKNRYAIRRFPMGQDTDLRKCLSRWRWQMVW